MRSHAERGNETLGHCDFGAFGGVLALDGGLVFAGRDCITQHFDHQLDRSTSVLGGQGVDGASDASAEGEEALTAR